MRARAHVTRKYHANGPEINIIISLAEKKKEEED